MGFGRNDTKAKPTGGPPVFTRGSGPRKEPGQSTGGPPMFTRSGNNARGGSTTGSRGGSTTGAQDGRAEPSSQGSSAGGWGKSNTNRK